MKQMKAMGWSLLLWMVLAGGGLVLPRPANAQVQCKVSATTFTLMVSTNLSKYPTFSEFNPVNTPPEFTNSIPPKFYRQWSICQTGTAFYTDDYRLVQSDGGTYSYSNTAFSAGVRMWTGTNGVAGACWSGAITNITNWNFFFTGSLTNNHTNYVIHTTNVPSITCEGGVDGPVFIDPTTWTSGSSSNSGTSPAHQIFRYTGYATNGGTHFDSDGVGYSRVWTGTNNAVVHNVLFDEYTTGQLRTNAANALTNLSWPTNSSGGEDWQAGGGQAMNVLSPDESSIQMAKCRYRFEFPTQVGCHYRLSWKVYTTTYDTNGAPHVTIAHYSPPKTYPGTGDTQRSDEVLLVLPPEGQKIEIRDPKVRVISTACTSIDFDSTSFYLCKGEQTSLWADVLPAGSPVSWISSDPSIATVSGPPPNLTLTASTNTGVTLIQGVVRVGGSNYLSDPVTVTVVDVQVAGPLAVGTGAYSTFSATIAPPNLPISFTTEDPSIAYGWGSGSPVTLYGVAAGQTHLRASLNNILLPCFQAGIMVSNIPSVSFLVSSLTLCLSNATALTATITPPTNTVTFDCVDPAIASVTVSGDTNLTITGNAPGTTQLRAKFGTLVIGTMDVTVVSVGLPSGLLVATGGSGTFVATVQPASLASQISYQSDNPAIAAVWGSGTQFTVAGYSNGVTQVKALLNGTELCRSTTVRVSDAVPGVGLPSLISICHAQSGAAQIPVTPTNAAITYATVDPTVASISASTSTSVDLTGGTSGGSTTLQAFWGTNLLGSTEVRCVRVDFPTNSAVLGVGGLASYPVTVIPAVSVSDITFDTPGTNATLTSSGNSFTVTGVGAGTATVRALLNGTPICDTWNCTITNTPTLKFVTGSAFLCAGSQLSVGVSIYPNNLAVTYEIDPSNGILASVGPSSNHIVLMAGNTNGAVTVYAKSGGVTFDILNVTVFQISFPTNPMVAFGTAPTNFVVDVQPVGDAGMITFMTTNTPLVTVSGGGTNLAVAGISNGFANVVAMIGTNHSCTSALLTLTNGPSGYFSPPSLVFCAGTNTSLSCTASPPSLALSFEVADGNQGFLTVSGPVNGVYDLTFNPWYPGTNEIRALSGTNLIAQATVMAVSVDFGLSSLTLSVGGFSQFSPTILPPEAVTQVSFVSGDTNVFQPSWQVLGGTALVSVAASPTNSGIALLNARVGTNQICSAIPVTVGNVFLQASSTMVCPGTTNRVGFTLSPPNFPVTWLLATNTVTVSIDDTNLVLVGVSPGTNELTAVFGTNVLARLQITVPNVDFGINDLIVLVGRTNNFYTLITPTNAAAAITYQVDASNAIATVTGSNTMFSAKGLTNGYTVVQAWIGTNLLCNAATLTVLDFSLPTNKMFVCQGGSGSLPLTWSPTNFVLGTLDQDTNFTSSSIIGTNLVVNGVTNGTSHVSLYAGTNFLADIQVTVIDVRVPTNELVIAQDQRVSYPVDIRPASAIDLVKFQAADTNTVAAFYTNGYVHVVGRLDGDTLIVPMVGTNALCAIRNISVTNCACRCLPGETTFDFSEKLHLRLNLGLRDGGRTAGHLRFVLDNATFTNRALRYSHERSGFPLTFDTNGVVSEVQAPQAFATVTFDTNQTSLRVDFSQSGAVFATVAVAQAGGGIVVTESRGGVTRTTACAYDGASQTWTYNQPLRVVEASGSGSISMRELNGVLASQRTLSRTVFGWGRETTSDSAGGQNTTYTYDPNTARLLSIQHPDGSSEARAYDPTGLLTQRVQPFANSNGGRTNLYDYTPLIGADDGSLKPDEPRTISEYLQGILVQQHTLTYTPTQKVETVTVSGISQTNITDYDTTNGGPAEVVWRVRRSDGLTEIHTYPWGPGNGLEVIARGIADESGTVITNGTTTVIQTGYFGETLSTSVSDIATGATLSSQTYGNWDNFNRPGFVSTISGARSFTYGCCTLDSETEPDGTVVTYGYDALNRLVTTTRNGIATIQDYNAAGQVVRVTRQGTDNTSIAVTRSTYDAGGRLTSQQDALGHTTYFAESGATRTTTSADGGTRIETRALDGSLLSLSGSATHPVTYAQGVVSVSAGGIPAGTRYTIESRAAVAGGAALEQVTTYTDAAGRTLRISHSDATATYFDHNTLGQLISQTARDGMVTLYAYNPLGEREYSVLDLNRNYHIDLGGADRVTRVVNDVWNGLRRSRTYVWDTVGQDVATLVSVRTESMDGNTVSSTVGLAADGTGGVTTTTQTTLDGNGARTTTTTAPDGSTLVEEHQNGLLATATRRAADGTQLSQLTHGYDAHGRLATTTDARSGTTTYAYDAADRMLGALSPAPAAGQSQLLTLRTLDAVGRVTLLQQPDGTTVTNTYFPSGALRRTSGSRVYPVEYAYDAQGRMLTMQTWTNLALNNGVAVTTWSYDATTGWLTNKTYDGGAPGLRYEYFSGGRIHRISRAFDQTSYTYDNAGQVATATQNGPGLNSAHTYDRRGRVARVTEAIADYIGNFSFVTNRIDLTYNVIGQVASESRTVNSGRMGGYGITNEFDALFRRTAVRVTRDSGANINNITVLAANTFTYDAASRLASVGDGNALTATYGYVVNVPMIGSVTFAGGGQPWLTTTREYDLRNRLTNITSVSAGSAPAASAAYNYNLAQQRTKRTEADGSFWTYQYDALGQVTVGTRQWADGTLVPGQQFEFTYDDIGNRLETRTGGDTNGSNLRVSTYAQTNRLNQPAQRTVPGFAELQGQANAAATVTVDANPTERRGPFWRHELPVNNTGAVNRAFTVIGVLQGAGPNGKDVVSQQTGTVFVARSPQTNGFDQAGRLTQDGQWDYQWDAEDRLIRMQSLSEVPASARQRIFFGYDHLGRRTEKVTYKWVNGDWSWVQTRQYLYDGWNLLAELDHYHDVVRTYGWGADLSGTLSGAGGVGGLVFVKQADGSAGFPAYDGNGNVTALYSATDGGELARYEHAPFGELLRASGPWASANPFRFSTKYQDDETGWYFYGYRYYGPSGGRWLSRDPLGEAGGWNLYGFVKNNPLNFVDSYGLEVYSDYLDLYQGQLQQDQVADYVMGDGWSIASRSRTEESLEVMKAVGKEIFFGVVMALAPEVAGPRWVTWLVGRLPGRWTAKILPRCQRASKTGADSALQSARLGEHLTQLEKYGAQGFKELENGSIRYYGDLKAATTPGEMSGARLVREWNPATGGKRTWMETLDQSGTVRSVRPETGGPKVHYIFDANGNYIGTR